MQYRGLLIALILVAIGTVLAGSPAHAQTPNHSGMWNLAQVNGQALPVITETTTDCEESVLSGMLMLEPGGDWEFEYMERETCGNDVDEDGEKESGDYSVSGQQIIFSDDKDDFDPDDLDIDELGIGTVSGNQLSVTLQDGQTVLTFTR